MKLNTSPHSSPRVPSSVEAASDSKNEDVGAKRKRNVRFDRDQIEGEEGSSLSFSQDVQLGNRVRTSGGPASLDYGSTRPSTSVYLFELVLRCKRAAREMNSKELEEGLQDLMLRVEEQDRETRQREQVILMNEVRQRVRAHEVELERRITEADPLLAGVKPDWWLGDRVETEDRHNASVALCRWHFKGTGQRAGWVAQGKEEEELVKACDRLGIRRVKREIKIVTRGVLLTVEIQRGQLDMRHTKISLAEMRSARKAQLIRLLRGKPEASLRELKEALTASLSTVEEEQLAPDEGWEDDDEEAGDLATTAKESK